MTWYKGNSARDCSKAMIVEYSATWRNPKRTNTIAEAIVATTERRNDTASQACPTTCAMHAQQDCTQQVTVCLTSLGLKTEVIWTINYDGSLHISNKAFLKQERRVIYIPQSALCLTDPCRMAYAPMVCRGVVHGVWTKRIDYPGSLSDCVGPRCVH